MFRRSWSDGLGKSTRTSVILSGAEVERRAKDPVAIRQRLAGASENRHLRDSGILLAIAPPASSPALSRKASALHCAPKAALCSG